MLEHAQARIFILEHARARSMLDFFILDATLLVIRKLLHGFQSLCLVHSKIVEVEA